MMRTRGDQWRGRGYEPAGLSIGTDVEATATKSDIQEILSGIEELKTSYAKKATVAEHISSDIIWMGMSELTFGESSDRISPFFVQRMAVALLCMFAAGAFVIASLLLTSLSVEERIVLAAMAIPALGTAVAACMAVAAGAKYDE